MKSKDISITKIENFQWRVSGQGCLFASVKCVPLVLGYEDVMLYSEFQQDDHSRWSWQVYHSLEPRHRHTHPQLQPGYHGYSWTFNNDYHWWWFLIMITIMTTISIRMSLLILVSLIVRLLKATITITLMMRSLNW